LKVALDEGVPERLAKYLPGHDVQTVRQLRLKGVKNGKLLAAIEAMAFEAFITNDKRMEAEGQLLRRSFGILIPSATNWPFILPNVGKIAAALDHCQTGKVMKVDCGRFVPRKFRKPSDPPSG
jgi:hypothetical protein